MTLLILVAGSGRWAVSGSTSLWSDSIDLFGTPAYVAISPYPETAIQGELWSHQVEPTFVPRVPGEIVVVGPDGEPVEPPEPPPAEEIEYRSFLEYAPKGMRIIGDTVVEWIPLDDPEGLDYLFMLNPRPRLIVEAWHAGTLLAASSVEYAISFRPLQPRLSSEEMLRFTEGRSGTEFLALFDADDRANGQDLRITLLSAPEGLHVSENLSDTWQSLRFDWTPPHGSAGLHSVVLKLEDGNEHGEGPFDIAVPIEVAEAPPGLSHLDWYQSLRTSPFPEGVGQGFALAIDAGSGRAVSGAPDDAGTGTLIAFELGEATELRRAGVWEAVQRLVPEQTVVDGIASSWSESATLVPEAFGASVAMDGEWLLVGAPESDLLFGSGTLIDAGACFLYRWDEPSGSWQFFQVLVPPYPPHSGESPRYFGGWVDLEEGLAVVGEDGHGESHGAVYAFSAGSEGGLWKGVRVESGSAPGDFMGYPVATDGWHVVAASNESDERGLNSGKVTTWQQRSPAERYGSWQRHHLVDESTLYASVSQLQSLFGERLSLDRRRLAVASMRADAYAGAVDIYETTSGEWRHCQRIAEPDTVLFGSSVVMDGDYLVILTPSVVENSFQSSSEIFGYGYVGGHWERLFRIEAGMGQSRMVGHNGQAIALSGQWLMVAAPDERWTKVFDLRDRFRWFERSNFDLGRAKASVADQWRAGDSDGDGVADIVEALMERDPLRPAGGHTHSPQLIRSDTLGQERWLLEFPEAAGVEGLELRIERSADLLHWVPVNRVEVDVSRFDGECWWRRLRLPEGFNGDRAIVRLRVEAATGSTSN